MFYLDGGVFEECQIGLVESEVDGKVVVGCCSSGGDSGCVGDIFVALTTVAMVGVARLVVVELVVEWHDKDLSVVGGGGFRRCGVGGGDRGVGGVGVWGSS